MVSSSAESFQAGLARDEIVPSRKKVKLPAWLEVAKPRLIPLLLATTLGGMALTEGWPLPAGKMLCTLGGGALAAAAAGALNCLWEQDLDKKMKRTSNRALPSGRLSQTSVFAGAIFCTLVADKNLIYWYLLLEMPLLYQVVFYSLPLFKQQMDSLMQLHKALW